MHEIVYQLENSPGKGNEFTMIGVAPQFNLYFKTYLILFTVSNAVKIKFLCKQRKKKTLQRKIADC